MHACTQHADEGQVRPPPPHSSLFDPLAPLRRARLDHSSTLEVPSQRRDGSFLALTGPAAPSNFG